MNAFLMVSACAVRQVRGLLRAARESNPGFFPETFEIAYASYRDNNAREATHLLVQEAKTLGGE